MTKRAWSSLGSLLLVSLLVLLSAPDAEARRRLPEGAVERLLDLDVRPFAIGHRGFGANLAAGDPSKPRDPSRPIENTVAGVRAAFLAGVSVVEIDVQLTRDHKVVAFHDDFTTFAGETRPTCLNTLRLSELQSRLPHVPTLTAVLAKARRFNVPSGPLGGVVIIELKAPAPLCDPHDRQERALVAAVLRVIRRMRMHDQVMLTSFSPSLLAIAARQDKDVARILSISGLQFLTPAQAEAALGLPRGSVVLIDKRRQDLGLQWAEIGLVFRLPGYTSVDEAVITALTVGARVMEADLAFFDALGPMAPALVGHLHSVGLKVFGFTAGNEMEWMYLESLGVDGIYTNDVPLGVQRQAPIP